MFPRGISVKATFLPKTAPRGPCLRWGDPVPSTGRRSLPSPQPRSVPLPPVPVAGSAEVSRGLPHHMDPYGWFMTLLDQQYITTTHRWIIVDVHATKTTICACACDMYPNLSLVGMKILACKFCVSSLPSTSL